MKGTAEQPADTRTPVQHRVAKGMDTTFLSLFLLALMKSFNLTIQQRHFGNGTEFSFTDQEYSQVPAIFRASGEVYGVPSKPPNQPQRYVHNHKMKDNMNMGLGRISGLQDLGRYCRRGHHLIPFINSLYFPCGRDIQASCAAINFPLEGQSSTKPPWIAINTYPATKYLYLHP